MSRNYEVSINIEAGVTETEAQEIKSLCQKEAEEVEFYSNLGQETDILIGLLTLGAGVTHDEWAEIMSREIWLILKRPLYIEFSWWFLDREPDDRHSFDDEDFGSMFHALDQLAMTGKDPVE